VSKAKAGNKTKNKRLLAHGSDEMSTEENPSRKKSIWRLTVIWAPDRWSSCTRRRLCHENREEQVLLMAREDWNLAEQMLGPRTSMRTEEKNGFESRKVKSSAKNKI
jgi:hypothetical protein